MAQCKTCEKKGIFLSLTPSGLCKDCVPLVKRDINQRAKIIGDCVRIMKESKNLKTRVSRCDVLREQAEALLDYERKDIPTLEVSPSEVIEACKSDREELICEGVETEVKEALGKAEVITSLKKKITAAEKALLIIQEWRAELRDSSRLDTLDSHVKQFIHKTQLDSYLEAARKAEFKGQNKKALDQYQEALYYLRTDAVDDSTQVSQIAELECKIKELQN